MSGVKTSTAKRHVQCDIPWYAVTDFCRDKTDPPRLIEPKLARKIQRTGETPATLMLAAKVYGSKFVPSYEECVSIRCMTGYHYRNRQKLAAPPGSGWKKRI